MNSSRTTSLDTLSLFGSTIDKNQVPPIQQKRLLAFVNHFIVNTVEFLNDFAVNAETKFIECERKIQKIEAALLILEAKISSIPNLPARNEPKTEQIQEPQTVIQSHNTSVSTEPSADKDNVVEEIQHDVVEPESETSLKIKACDDTRYRKYFKMMQFGVPKDAVKLKMEAEGFDGRILDTPDKLLDGVEYVPEEI